jgi:tetratricopeptide (TPR) repeat protein
MIWIALLLLWQADPDPLRFEQAQQLASRGRCQDAAPALKQLAAAHPKVLAIVFTLGQCEFNAKNYLAALDSLGRALQIDPHRVEAQALYGAALGLSGRTAEAIVQLREAVRSNHAFAPNFRLLGMFEVEDGQPGKEARSALERAVALDPSDARTPIRMLIPSLIILSTGKSTANHGVPEGVKSFGLADLQSPSEQQDLARPRDALEPLHALAQLRVPAQVSHQAVLRGLEHLRRAPSEFQ